MENIDRDDDLFGESLPGGDFVSRMARLYWEWLGSPTEPVKISRYMGNTVCFNPCLLRDVIDTLNEDVSAVDAVYPLIEGFQSELMVFDPPDDVFCRYYDYSISPGQIRSGELTKLYSRSGCVFCEWLTPEPWFSGKTDGRRIGIKCSPLDVVHIHNQIDLDVAEAFWMKHNA